MVLIFKLLSKIPERFIRVITETTFKILNIEKLKSYKITLANISLCFPNYSNNKKNKIAKDSYIESIISIFQTFYAWGNSPKKVNSRILRVTNNFFINNNNSLIVGSIHNRSVDMILSWMNTQRTTTTLFKKIKYKQLNDFVKSNREKQGSKVYETNLSGVKMLLKTLNNGGTICFAADQVPQEGMGKYLSLFGQETYSTTLINSLHLKTHKDVLYACMNTNEDKNLYVNIIEPTIDSKHLLSLNKTIEKLIKENITDYSWEYKRFKNNKNKVDIYIN